MQFSQREARYAPRNSGLYWGSFRQPTPRLLQLVSRKKLHRRATDSRSGKSQRKSLPTWLSDDSDLGNLAAMRDHKIEIIPIRATFPTLKVFKNGQQTRFRSGFDLARDCPLLCVKFGLFQSAADAQHKNVVRLIPDFDWHDRVFYLLGFS